jgi:transcriptional regulator with XRE-family HTH domain
MAAAQAPTVRRRRLGAELRRLREAAGLTLAEAAADLDTSDSTLSRVENGRGRVRRTDVQAMLDLYDVRDPVLREGLLRITRDMRRKGWWQNYRDVISEPYGDYISLETDAASLRIFTLELLPGLLQTQEYTRAVAEAGLVWETPEEIDNFVSVRAQRQQVLHGEEPLQLWAVMHETALHQQVGGSGVMRAQFEHLMDSGRQPNVTIQIIPHKAGAHATMDMPFTILGFSEPTDPDVVCLDHLTSTLYVEVEDEVNRYTLMFDHLRSTALAPRESMSRIAERIKEL